MITNKDMDELMVVAEITTTEDVDRAIREFYRPDVEQEAAVMYASLPESFKTILRRKAPEAVKNIEELMKR